MKSISVLLFTVFFAMMTAAAPASETVQLKARSEVTADQKQLLSEKKRAPKGQKKKGPRGQRKRVR
jgi:hypothetical protein